MYSPHSPTLSGNGYGGHDYHHHHHLNQHNHNSTNSHLNAGFHLSSASSPSSYSTTVRSSSSQNHHQHQQTTNALVAAAAAAAAAAANTTTSSSLIHTNTSSTSIQCLRFKYFATFLICTTCLALLSASLATHKWLISKPVRVLRLTNGQTANFTALMLTATLDDHDHNQRVLLSNNNKKASSQKLQISEINQLNQNQHHNQQSQPEINPVAGQVANSKFQGEIYFGLFNGVKVLNYGFGERVSQLSVLQAYYATATTTTTAHELINFKFWLITLTSVVLGIVFALIGSIFAIINFVMTPRATLMGPVGLVIWNASACFVCLIAMFAWLVEYFLRLKANVLTPEEVINGWTSENRSQFGYSYYFVVLAFCLHLVNIFIVSIVQADTWTSGHMSAGKLSSSSSARRHNRASACEGVIMLY